jgi:hypothetical protein
MRADLTIAGAVAEVVRVTERNSFVDYPHAPVFRQCRSGSSLSTVSRLRVNMRMGKSVTDTNINKVDMHVTTLPTRVLDRLLDPVIRCLSPRAARELAGLRGDEEVQARVRELAEKCNEGTLSAEERAEYEAYVMAANIVAILQAKARARLRASP